ncbi:EamA family transporter [Microbulbifer variabilis]|uniref:EamA family transporter n=1 Tax=Microbulbifer variabilis TaxID=266805 RepID=UPI001CFD46A5|nr:EamA family transporter [Microbulbifer variabilis]
MPLKDLALACTVVIIWGVNFSVIKIGLEELPPILFSALRFLIVAIPAVLFIPFPKTSPWNLLGVGVFLGVFKFGLLFFAMKADASAGISSLILQAQVFFTILLSAILYKEAIGRYQLLGIFIAMAGFSLFLFSSEGSVTSFGLVLLLLAAFFWALSNLIMKRTQGVNLLHFMVWVCLVPPIPLFTLSYFLETQDPLTLIISTNAKTWLSLAFVSYISTLIAFAIWGKLLRAHSAATVTPFALLIPVVGVITSSIILDEKLETIEIIGFTLIMAGLICNSLYSKLLGLVKASRQAVQVPPKI